MEIYECQLYDPILYDLSRKDKMSLVILAFFTNLDSYVGNPGRFYECQRENAIAFAAIFDGIAAKFLEFSFILGGAFLWPCVIIKINRTVKTVDLWHFTIRRAYGETRIALRSCGEIIP